MSLSHQPADVRSSRVSARSVAVMAVFIALSAVGALIKIPSPAGTVAFDSAPGYFVALAFGGPMGFVVIALGHILTASMAGFPYTLPVHLAIAVGMGICALLLRWIGHRGGLLNLVIGGVVAVLFNTFALALVVVPTGGWGAYVAVIPSLLVGAILNVAVASIAWRSLRGTRLVD
ncbi:ECF transporter S component [Propionibacterium sp.]|uniref:ECF transporter S component n=1 Tax=Propionibacterium sp. TaxID=1977903 RepID=UPI0039ED476A